MAGKMDTGFRRAVLHKRKSRPVPGSVSAKGSLLWLWAAEGDPPAAWPVPGHSRDPPHKNGTGLHPPESPVGKGIPRSGPITPNRRWDNARRRGPLAAGRQKRGRPRGAGPGNPSGYRQRMDSRFQQRIGKNRLGLDSRAIPVPVPPGVPRDRRGRRPGFWGG